MRITGNGNKVFLFFAISLCLWGQLYGQSWSGIMAPSRAIDWTHAGVVGGIPSDAWMQCGSTIAAYNGMADSINNAIKACADNHYVLLGAGTFNLTSGIVMKNNVALRGAGADKTFLIFTGASSCNGSNPGICFLGDTIYYGSAYVQPGSTQAADWTAGYAQGTTSITLANVGSVGISNGSYVFLDQANDGSPGSGLIICSTSGTCAIEGGGMGRTTVGAMRGQVQVVQVVSGCSSTCKGAGPFNLTIAPGLYAPNWRSSQGPGAWFPSFIISNSGVENLSIDTSGIANSSSDYVGIQMDNAANCWVKGIRSIRNPGRRSAVALQNVSHASVVDSYFYSGGSGSSVNYAIEPLIASDVLIQNNIFQQIGPIISATSGLVVAYNFAINEPTSPTNWNSAMAWEHYGGMEYILYEGNIGPGITADAYHGNSVFNTLFRNRLTGRDTGKTNNTTAIELWAFNRYHNVIGNVLGVTGYDTIYNVAPGDSGQVGTIYNLGGGGSLSSDVEVVTSLMRWGNYDAVTAAVRWCGNSSDTGWSTTCASTSEVPSSLPSYSNSVPTYGDTGAGQSAMPASFYLPAKPAWWSSNEPWPAIGPDVTKGNLGICSGGAMAGASCTSSSECTGGGTCASTAGGYANSIPALDCYLTVMGGPADGSGSVLNFNANICYPAGSTRPAPPTNVTAVPH